MIRLQAQFLLQKGYGFCNSNIYFFHTICTVNKIYDSEPFWFHQNELNLPEPSRIIHAQKCPKISPYWPKIDVAWPESVSNKGNRRYILYDGFNRVLMRIKIESSFKESILNANNSIYEVFIFCGFCAHCIQKTIKSFFLKIEFCLRDERKKDIAERLKKKLKWEL